MVTTPASDGPFLGVDIGGTSIKWSVVRGGDVEATGEVATPRTEQHAVLRAVADLATGVPDALSGIGMAVPGTVDTVRRSTLVLPNLPGDWNGLAAADEVEQLVGLPVALLNDARAFAWAELTRGAARGVSSAQFVTLGTGVGGAIAFRGEVLMGETDSIGEIGHTTVDPDGVPCPCGGRGCLETVASGTAIVGRLARAFALAQSPILQRLTKGGAEPLTARIAADAARLGDPWATEAFDRAAAALGRATATIGVLLHLDVVVIGGGLKPAADLYLPTVQRALDERTSLSGSIAARSAYFGTEAGSIGAAAFAAARLTDPSTTHNRERTRP